MGREGHSHYSKEPEERNSGGGESLFRHIAVCASFIQAARLALKSIPEIDKPLKGEVIVFARSAATLRYTIEGIVAFIDSTYPPKKTPDSVPNVTAEEVHALIPMNITSWALKSQNSIKRRLWLKL